MNARAADAPGRGYFFEDFDAGMEFVSARRTVTGRDIAAFVELTGVLNPLFVDRDYATELFGGPIAPGQLTLSLALGLSEPLVHGTAIALLSLDNVRFTSPLRPETPIEVVTKVVSSRPTKRPDAGIVALANAVRTDSGETLMTFDRTVLVKRRGDG